MDDQTKKSIDNIRKNITGSRPEAGESALTAFFGLQHIEQKINQLEQENASLKKKAETKEKPENKK